MTSPWYVPQYFAPRVEGQQEPDIPGERESQFLRDSRAGGAAPPKIKDLAPRHSREKSSSSDLVFVDSSDHQANL